MQIMTAMVPIEIVAPWSAWWLEPEHLPAYFAGHSAPALKSDRKRWTDVSIGRIKKLGDGMPPDVLDGDFEKLLKAARQPQRYPVVRILARYMPKWPAVTEGRVLRSRLGARWFQDTRYTAGIERERFLQAASATASWIARHRRKPQMFSAWTESLSSWNCPENSMAEVLYDDGLRRRFFVVLERFADGLVEDELHLLIHTVAHVPEGREPDYFASVRGDAAEMDADGFDDEVRQAMVLSGGNLDYFGPLLRTISAAGQYSRDTFAAITAMSALFDAAGVPDAVRHMAAGKRERELRRLARRCRLLAAGGAPLPPVPVVDAPDTAWLSAYPEEFHPLLQRLARLDPAAPRTAGRILHRDYPARDRWRRELEHLAALPSPPEDVKRRVANLTRYLAAPPPVSPQRRETLQSRLAGALRRVAWANWSAALDGGVVQKLSSLLEVEANTPWLARAEIQDALLHLIEMKETRPLAAAILHRRMEPPPWDLRDLPQNADFLRRMRERGLAMEPWLDDGPFTAKLDGCAGPLHCGLERDPLEILHMGGHFQTCLSPGNTNFFSVFANIADVNKQVFYVRDAGGKVCSRTLLALTASGEILLFYTYAHLLQEEMEALTNRYVQDLAARMGASICRQGAVPTLVAGRWYDDGPTDPSGMLHQTLAATGFAARLAGIAPDEFLSQAAADLEPLGLHDLTVAWLLAQPQMKARPDLLHILARQAERLRLTTETATCLIANLREAGLDGSLGLLVPVAERLLMRRLREPYLYHLCDLLELIMDHDPARALRLLRRTRPPSVRRWDQTDGHILGAAAVLHRRLRRPTKARRLLAILEAQDPGAARRFRAMEPAEEA